MVAVMVASKFRIVVPDELATLAPGTAQRAKGRARVREILQAAYELLGRGDLSEFSMRNVALKAGVDLKNVQYYFPTRKDLVRALLECIGHRHTQALKDTANMPPHEALTLHLEYWLDENLGAHHRRFNIHSWVIFDSCFKYSGEGLAQFYERFIQKISMCVSAQTPEISASELKIRTHLVASLLEGAMLTCCDLKPDEQKTFRNRTIAEALRIAMAA